MTYLHDGLADTGHVIVIATAEHREALRAALPPRRLEQERSTTFALFCAYPLADAQGQVGDGLSQICHRHTLIHMSRHLDPDEDTAGETARVLLDSTRALLRVDSGRRGAQRAVSDLGGTTVPVFQTPANALAGPGPFQGGQRA